MPLHAGPYHHVAAGPYGLYVRPFFDPDSPFVEHARSTLARPEDIDALEILRHEYVLPPPRQGPEIGRAAGRIRYDHSPTDTRTSSAPPPHPIDFFKPWLSCPALTLAHNRWQQEMCLIGHEPLLELTDRELVAVQEHKALHIFDYQSLKTWLRLSRGYSRRELKFKNPANGMWTPLSHLHRVILLDEAGVPLQPQKP